MNKKVPVKMMYVIIEITRRSFNNSLSVRSSISFFQKQINNEGEKDGF